MEKYVEDVLLVKYAKTKGGIIFDKAIKLTIENLKKHTFTE